jgi:anti-sigma regulatory factor (Ser/Thr protein kinase)
MIEISTKPVGTALKITSSAELISPLCEALHAICLHVTSSQHFASEIQFAVAEALNNVILHAYNNQPDHDIIVELNKQERILRIDIIDFGTSMSCLPAAILPDFERENGRGWWIINSCVDAYYYNVTEVLERKRVYKPEADSECLEDITIKSHRNALTLIKNF